MADYLSETSSKAAATASVATPTKKIAEDMYTGGPSGTSTYSLTPTAIQAPGYTPTPGQSTPAEPTTKAPPATPIPQQPPTTPQVVTTEPTANQSYGPDFQDYTGGESAYGTYAQKLESPEFMAQFLQGQYGGLDTGPIDVSQFMPTVQGRTAYDWQREQVTGQYEGETARQLEALEARMAAQGITGGAAQQMRNDLIRGLSMQRAMQMADISRQEAGFMQEAAMTEAAQRFSLKQQLIEQAFTSEMTYAQLNQREREIAENARQFDNNQDLQVWLNQQEMTNEERARVWQAIQNDQNRSLDAQDLQFKINDAQNRLAFQYQELATTTGLEREKLLGQIQMTQMEIDSAQWRVQYQAYADQQLATLNSELRTGEWDHQAETTQRQQSYYNMGKGGEELTQEQLDALHTQDPLAYYAYLDGKAGLSQAIFDANMDLRMNYLATAVGSLSNLTGSDFINALGDVKSIVDTMFSGTNLFSISGLVGGDQTVTPPGDGTITPPAPTTGPVSTGTTRDQGSTIAVSPDGYVHAYTLTTGIGSDQTTKQVRLTAYPTVTPTVGESTMIRGASGNAAPFVGSAYLYGPSTATYTPQYTYNSPEAQQYIASVNALGGSGPYSAVGNQYVYDSATLYQALGNTLAELPYLQAAESTVYVDRRLVYDPTTGTGGPASPGALQPQAALALMMLAAGRPVMNPDGSLASNHDPLMPTGSITELAGFVAPAPENMPLLDVSYMDQLRADGNLEQLQSLAYTYANIGGYPFALIPSYDATSGLPTNGLMAVSITNPTVSLRWEV